MWEYVFTLVHVIPSLKFKQHFSMRIIIKSSLTNTAWTRLSSRRSYKRAELKKHTSREVFAYRWTQQSLWTSGPISISMVTTLISFQYLCLLPAIMTYISKPLVWLSNTLPSFIRAEHEMQCHELVGTWVWIRGTELVESVPCDPTDFSMRHPDVPFE